jgi:hypothetical protein
LLKKIPHVIVLGNNTEYCSQEVKLLYIFFIPSLSPLSSLIQYSVTVDFGFGVGFRWQRWVYVWVSTAIVGLTLGFNGVGGGFVVGLMDGLGFVVGLDLGFESGGLRWVLALMVGGLGLRWVSA